MSQQTEEKVTHGVIENSKYHEKLLHLANKNVQAIKIYWPLLILSQAVGIAALILVFNQKNLHKEQENNNKRDIEQNKQQTAIKNLEQRFDNLNERFLSLQTQQAKIVKNLISLKMTLSSQKSESVKQNVSTAEINITQKTVLDTLDRIGDKIRLNESFASLLTSIPRTYINLPEYKILQKFSTRLPLTFKQLNKSFEEIQKNYTPQKPASNLPKWVSDIASVFHGTIKIEKADQKKENPLKSITDALGAQDLKSAHAFAKNFDNPSIKSWADLIAERISLEESYSLFAEKVQNLAQQTSQEIENKPMQKAQENLL